MYYILLFLALVWFCDCDFPTPRVEYDDIQGIWTIGDIDNISDSLTVDGDSMFSPDWDGHVYLVGEGCTRSDAYGKLIINIKWIKRGDTLNTPVPMHLSLEDLKGGDTLIVGKCVSINCYVNQFAKSDECYSQFDTLVRARN